MKPDAFEQRLSRQPVKPIPVEWRAEILATARAAQAIRHPPSVTRHSWLSTLHHQLASLLWPHPGAWAGLAAVWLLTLALNYSMRDEPPVLAVKAAPPSPEVLAELQQQHKLYAELLGMTETQDVDRPRVLSPNPRSEAVRIFAV
jgi:hypothetical protein